MKFAITLLALLTAIPAHSQVAPVPGQWYRLQAKHSDLYLDVSWGSLDEHAPVAQGGRSDWYQGAAQLWTLVPGVNGAYRLKVKHSEKYLEVLGARADEHAPVGQADLVNSPATAAQLWKLVDAGGGWYRLQVAHTGKYLDVAWGSLEDKAAVGQADFSDWNQGAAQLWRFVPQSRPSRGGPGPGPVPSPTPPPVPQPPPPPALKFIGTAVGQGLTDETAKVNFNLNQRGLRVVVQVRRSNGETEYRQFVATERRRWSNNDYEYQADITGLKRGLYEFIVSVQLASGKLLEQQGTFAAGAPVRIDPR